MDKLGSRAVNWGTSTYCSPIWPWNEGYWAPIFIKVSVYENKQATTSVTDIDLPQSRCCKFFFSFSKKKSIIKKKQRFPHIAVYLTVLIQIRKSSKRVPVTFPDYSKMNISIYHNQGVVNYFTPSPIKSLIKITQRFHHIAVSSLAILIQIRKSSKRVPVTFPDYSEMNMFKNK